MEKSKFTFYIIINTDLDMDDELTSIQTCHCTRQFIEHTFINGMESKEFNNYQRWRVDPRIVILKTDTVKMENIINTEKVYIIRDEFDNASVIGILTTNLNFL